AVMIIFSAGTCSPETSCTGWLAGGLAASLVGWVAGGSGDGSWAQAGNANIKLHATTTPRIPPNPKCQTAMDCLVFLPNSRGQKKNPRPREAPAQTPEPWQGRGSMQSTNSEGKPNNH